MLRHHCKTCRSPLHADDSHAECVSCLVKSHADSALRGTDCSHCESFSLASLCARIAFFSESDSVPHPPSPFSSSQGPVRKSSGAEDLSSQWQASSCRLNARVPRHHRRESIRLSSSPSMISVPPWLQATWSRSRRQMTRCLYALKWAIFSTWCQDRDLDPVISDVSVVLSFQQEMLDKQRSSSTIKVYAAAIAAFHAPIAGRSVGRDIAVTFYEAPGEWIPRVLVQFHLGTYQAY